MPDHEMYALELIPLRLIEEHTERVNEFMALARAIGVELGWHYILDLVWASLKYEEFLVNNGSCAMVMDAGAGVGVMQWWLASKGTDVLSVDRIPRTDLSLRFRSRFRVRPWKEGELGPWWKAAAKDARLLLQPGFASHLKRIARMAVSRTGRRVSRTANPEAGTVFLYTSDLASLEEVPDNSVDVIVSISALEHNSLQYMAKCVKRLRDVLRPGGWMIVTLPTSGGGDWFHEPSQGWCLSEETIRGLFQIPEELKSNFHQYEEYMQAIRRSSFLRRNLADFYRQSGRNGMPWGVWDPKYYPVGLVVAKPVVE